MSGKLFVCILNFTLIWIHHVKKLNSFPFVFKRFEKLGHYHIIAFFYHRLLLPQFLSILNTSRSITKPFIKPKELTKLSWSAFQR